MNRIEELREARNWSRRHLADLVGVSEATIGRWEKGEIGIAPNRLAPLAQALQVDIGDLFVRGVHPAASNDIEITEAPGGSAQLGAALGSRGLRFYRVITDVLSDTGIVPGDVIAVDTTPAAISGAIDGDAVVVRVRTLDILLLRQFLRPALIVTNRWGVQQSAVKLTDRTLQLEIVGVMLRPDRGA